MIRRLAALLLPALLAACATPSQHAAGPAAIKLQILGFNDFHGNLEPPRQSVDAYTSAGERVRIPVGGAAWFASAIDRYRATNPNTLVLSAGDMFGGSPITSSLFLDEPTIEVMNRIGVDFNALGNHEFDRGRQEVMRMQKGGCAKHTVREPCQIEKQFAGANFPFLAANVVTEEGKTLFPATGIRRFGKGRNRMTVGVIGLPLKDVPTLASPSGLAGLDFREEADTVNALIPGLRRQGADVIVVVIHQGLYTTVGANDTSCGGVSGDLLKILARLDSSVDLVVSGHTHWAYICDYGKIDPSRRFLVTSAGLWGEYLTDIDLEYDPASRRIVSRSARNVPVQSEQYASTVGSVAVKPEFETFAPRPDIAAIVQRYVDAVRTQKLRPVGKVSASADKPALATNESRLGNLIADSQLEAARPSGARFALMNNTGIRADLMAAADGTVTFGAIYAVQPFANEIKVMTLNGSEVKAVLEQQLDDQSFDQTFSPSANLSYAFDKSRPLGERIFDITIDGKPIDPQASYRVAVNSFLASGGDSFSVFRKGRDVVVAAQDLEAVEKWIAAVPVRELPPLGRVRDMTPRPPAN
ncbi:MAG: bifunctional UDP-sugar hydrolase/5'-nucleotidase [Novosphingobium sp.]